MGEQLRGSCGGGPGGRVTVERRRRSRGDVEEVQGGRHGGATEGGVEEVQGEQSWVEESGNVWR